MSRQFCRMSDIKVPKSRVDSSGNQTWGWTFMIEIFMHMRVFLSRRAGMIALAVAFSFIAPLAIFAQDNPPEEVKYPGEPEPANSARNKIETSLGALKVRLYGTALLNL